MLASSLKEVVDLQDLKDTLKETIEKIFELNDTNYHQVEIEIIGPPGDTNAISVKFNIKADHYNKIKSKLEDITQLTESLDGVIDKTVYPDTEITNVNSPQITEIPTGSAIDS